MAKAKKQDWFERWKFRSDIYLSYLDLGTRYLDLLIETGDQCYWNAYMNNCKKENFHKAIADRMWNRHHPEF